MEENALSGSTDVDLIERNALHNFSRFLDLFLVASNNAIISSQRESQSHY